jgi:hypothetical protein
VRLIKLTVDSGFNIFTIEVTIKLGHIIHYSIQQLGEYGIFSRLNMFGDLVNTHLVISSVLIKVFCCQIQILTMQTSKMRFMVQ